MIPYIAYICTRNGKLTVHACERQNAGVLINIFYLKLIWQ